MSVFDVLGATATIIQFIEYGIKFGGKAIAVYNGGGRFAELEQMTQDFQRTNQTFKASLQLRSTGPDSGEEILLKIAEECQQTAEELTVLISHISMKQGERSRWKALKSTAKTEYRKDEVLAKQEKLRLLRKRCHEQLSMMISDQQFALAVSLARIERNQANAESTLALQLTDLKDQIVSAMANVKPSGTGELVRKLSAAQRMVTQDLPREAILTSLRYTEIDYRQSSIVDPSHSTYSWIFDDAGTGQATTQYMPWLSEGSGIFWVTGKAGSGKSTLMKHIYQDERTHSALRSWAKGRRLFTASHYFWYAGSQVEKSYSGLMRSILYKILYSCPDLTESVCKERWRDELRGRDTSALLWGIDELQACLDVLVSQSLKLVGKQICFCFFIDGLDEYEGDREVISALMRLSKSGHTKICASSRPWNRFTDAFAACMSQGNYLKLHQHTRGDIATYVQVELGHTLSNLSKVYQDWEPLVREVIDRSEGVFLWVALVVKRELRPMLEDRESIAAIRKRLDEVPPDLHDYFQRIFDRIWSDDKRADERYGEDTAKIFKSCIAAYEPLSALALPVILSDSPYDMAISANVGQDIMWDGPDGIDIARAQVNRRCQDLLSIVVPHQGMNLNSVDCRIEFLHRSVKDFLEQSVSVSEKLERLAGPSFSAARTLFACYIRLIKGSTRDTARARSWSTEALLQLASIDDEYDKATARLLRELDEAMQVVCSHSSKHWTNDSMDDTSSRTSSRKCPSSPNTSALAELGQRDLIGHLIELNLVHPVKAAMATSLPAKKYRPYLDYALRYKPDAYHTRSRPRKFWLQSSGNPAMVEYLLSMGCDVNEHIYVYSGRTVWDLYLAFLVQQDIKGERHRKTTWLLINHGAKPIRACLVRKSQRETVEFSMKYILSRAFGEREAVKMCERIAKNEFGWWSWLTAWTPRLGDGA